MAHSITEQVGKYLRPLFWFAYSLGKALRTAAPATVLVLLALGIGGAAYGIGASFASGGAHAFLGFGAAFLAALILYWLARSRVWTIVVLAILIALGLFFVSPAGVALRSAAGGALVSVGSWVKP